MSSEAGCCICESSDYFHCVNLRLPSNKMILSTAKSEFNVCEIPVNNKLVLCSKCSFVVSENISLRNKRQKKILKQRAKSETGVPERSTEIQNYTNTRSAVINTTNSNTAAIPNNSTATKASTLNGIFPRFEKNNSLFSLPSLSPSRGNMPIVTAAESSIRQQMRQTGGDSSKPKIGVIKEKFKNKTSTPIDRNVVRHITGSPKVISLDVGIGLQNASANFNFHSSGTDRLQKYDKFKKKK